MASVRPPSSSLPSSPPPVLLPQPPQPHLERLDSDSEDDQPDQVTVAGEAVVKKKKKKRQTAAQKTAAKARRAQEAAVNGAGSTEVVKRVEEDPYKGVWAWLARNKHLKYISLFNGPWLSLNQRDISAYLVVNTNERSRSSLRGLLDAPIHPSLSSLSLDVSGSCSHSSSPSSDSQALTTSSHAHRCSGHTVRFPPEYLLTLADDDIPAPLDAAAFQNTLEIRKLVDEAADLTLRAASGMSAVELEKLSRNPYGMGSERENPYGGGGGGGGNSGGNGRGPPQMSALRQHRFRALAVAKLAAAYRIDEVATAVVVMQAGENLEELAGRVCKQEPENLDAKYVQHFSEKIPSRALSPATDIDVFDSLIAASPHELAYYRSKGVLLSTFKQNYPAAISTFTQGLAQAKADREAAAAPPLFASKPPHKKSSKRADSPSHARDSPHDSRNSSPARGSSGRSPDPPPTLGTTAGDDLERQLIFHRGMANFHFARQLLEDAILELEGVVLPPNRRNDEGGAWTLRNLNLPDTPGGLYGSRPAATQARYRERLGEPVFLGKVNTALRKAVQDLDRFLAHFPIYEAPAGSPLEQLPRLSGHSGLEPPRPAALEEPLTFLGRRLVHHRSLSTRTFYRDPRQTPTFHIPNASPPSPPSSQAPSPSSRASPSSSSPSNTLHLPRALLTTFHPFLLEAHCTRLISLFLLGDFAAAAQAHTTFVRLAEQIEGYPLFSPPRVGTQAEYAELAERVWGTWGRKREKETGSTALVVRKSSARDADSDGSGSGSDDEEEEEGKAAMPENKAHLSAVGPANGALKSLEALTSLFSESFRTAYVSKAEAWWASTGKAEEERREAYAAGRKGGAGGAASGGGGSEKLRIELLEQLYDEAEAKAGKTKPSSTTPNGSGDGRKGTWLQEREKAEAKMRKIDPSYAPLTTAHTELALTFLSAAVLPPLEAREKVELEEEARGKGAQTRRERKGKGRAAVDEEDEGEMKTRASWNGAGGGAGGAGGSSGGGSSSASASRAFDPFGTGPAPSSSSSTFSMGGDGENGASGSSSSSSGSKGEGKGTGTGKGKGKGKSRAA